jgi:hypothetical protein
MTVTLTDEQAKNWAATLRNMEKVLDPPATTPGPAPAPTPTPTPTPDGGTVIVDPSGFPGGLAGVDTALWNANPVFQENFPNLANKGEFLGKYSKWGAYPTNYLVTDKQGFYDPGQISVKDITLPDGSNRRVMDCELRPKSMTAPGTCHRVVRLSRGASPRRARSSRSASGPPTTIPGITWRTSAGR